MSEASVAASGTAWAPTLWLTARKKLHACIGAAFYSSMGTAVVTCNAGLDARIIHQVGALLSSYIAVWTYWGSVERFRFQNLLWRAANHAGRHEDYSAWPTNVLIAYRALIVHKNTVGGEIWCSFLPTHAFLLGNGQTYATRGVPYYRVSRIFMSRNFMSRIFSVPAVLWFPCRYLFTWTHTMSFVNCLLFFPLYVTICRKRCTESFHSRLYAA